MSPTTNPSVCRYCNARRLPDQGDGVIRFACGTTMQASTNKTITQSTECKLRIELASARARIAELEACIGECDRHAIKILQIKWGNDGDCGAVQYADAITDATETALAKLSSRPGLDCGICGARITHDVLQTPV